jgi:hypothetical protein
MNRDWFAKQPLHISYRVSPWLKNSPRTRGLMDLGIPVVFSLDRYCRLTEVKVFKVGELETNKYALPIWSLTTDSNSVPTASFTYGQRIRGMRPAVKGARPYPLEPNVLYQLVLKTDKDESQRDFTTTPLLQHAESAVK